MWSRINSYFKKWKKNVVKEVLEWINRAHLSVYIVNPRNLQKKKTTHQCNYYSKKKVKCTKWFMFQFSLHKVYTLINEYVREKL